MNEERKDTSKQVLLSVLGVAILIVAVVGISFAAFTYSRAGERENIVTTGTITMSYDETTNGINIANATPMTEVEAVTATAVNNTGKDETNDKTSASDNVFDFTVEATIAGKTTINYEVVAIKANSEDSACTSTVYNNADRIGTKDEDKTTVHKAAVAESGTPGEADYVAAQPAVVGDAGAYAQCSLVSDDDIRLRLDRNTSANTFTIDGSTGAETADNATTVFTANKFTADTTSENTDTGRAALSDGMQLTTGSFTNTTGSNTTTHYYRLWMWVADGYVTDSVARTYKVKVNVYGKTATVND